MKPRSFTAATGGHFPANVTVDSYGQSDPRHKAQIPLGSIMKSGKDHFRHVVARQFFLTGWTQ